MKKMLKQERGVSLISLAAAIVVIGIVVTMLLYSVKDTKDVTNLTNMYTDIDNLTDKILNYYSVYGKIPAVEISGLDNVINSTWNNPNEDPRGANDTGKFMCIDLNAIDNLTLNYGKSFEKIAPMLNKNETINIEEDSEKYLDLYIINENSHNVFYLKGINIEGTTYYTNKDKDLTKVDLKYVDGVKILDGFTYKSGRKKESTNPIKITDGTNEYFWANIEDGIYRFDESTMIATDSQGNTISIKLVESQDKDDFLTSVHEFGGFYLNENGNIHYTLVIDKWSKTYDAQSVYKDRNGDTAYIPAGFQISELHTMNTINKGFVIRNGTTLDEYVWIDIPDYVLSDVHTLDGIERALKNYSSSYHEDGYEDTWYEGCGIATKEEYNNLKNKMYLSIKENGGFYVGRYEAGKSSDNKAISQKDKQPWNSITVSDAQIASNSLSTDSYTTSLMFGIQWDLVCKFIEETGEKSLTEIKDNSREWGNYPATTFKITSNNAKGLSTTSGWINVTKGSEKISDNYYIFTTGASDRNMALNIYDLAGNISERTLECFIDENKMVRRGGFAFYTANGINYGANAAFHAKNEINYVNASDGFRVTLFQNPTQNNN